MFYNSLMGQNPTFLMTHLLTDLLFTTSEIISISQRAGSPRMLSR